MADSASRTRRKPDGEVVEAGSPGDRVADGVEDDAALARRDEHPARAGPGGLGEGDRGGGGQAGGGGEESAAAQPQPVAERLGALPLLVRVVG
jgi:hypothetical protein